MRRLGIVPFFENPVPGYSIEELTPLEFWFDGLRDHIVALTGAAPAAVERLLR